MKTCLVSNATLQASAEESLPEDIERIILLLTLTNLSNLSVNARHTRLGC
jgi:hypothetical protein